MVAPAGDPMGSGVSPNGRFSTRGETSMSSSWLLVERLENWNVDAAEGFQRFGLSEYKTKLAEQIKTGDRLIVYVSSGISAFSDIRESVSDGYKRLRFGGDYDTAFPISISTRPVLTLPRQNWVPVQSLISSLAFTRDRKDWRQVMRNALRHLTDEDAEILSAALNVANKNKKVV